MKSEEIRSLYPSLEPFVSLRRNPKNTLVHRQGSKTDLVTNEDLSRLLLLCDGHKSVEEICDSLSTSKFYSGVPKEEFYNESVAVLRDLAGKGFVQFLDYSHISNARVRIVESEFPLNTVYIEPTKRCNLRCIHCFAGAPSLCRGVEDRPLDDWLNIIGQLDMMGVMSLLVTGGEAFYRRDIFSILTEIHERKMEFGILTNATLLTPEKIRRLAALQPKFVAVSFESHRPEAFEEIRGRGNYRRTLESIREMVREGLPVNVNRIMFKGVNDTYQDLVEYLHFMKSEGIPGENIAIDELLKQGEGSKIPEMTVDSWNSMQIVKKAFREVYDMEFGVIKPGADFDSYCGVGRDIAYITADGDLTLCPVMNDRTLVAGNVLETPLKKLWEESPLFHYFRENLHVRSSECASCSYLNGCFGGCKAKSRLNEGRFNAPDKWMCAFFDKRMPAAASES